MVVAGVRLAYPVKFLIEQESANTHIGLFFSSTCVVSFLRFSHFYPPPGFLLGYTFCASSNPWYVIPFTVVFFVHHSFPSLSFSLRISVLHKSPSLTQPVYLSILPSSSPLS